MNQTNREEKKVFTPGYTRVIYPVQNVEVCGVIWNHAWIRTHCCHPFEAADRDVCPQSLMNEAAASNVGSGAFSKVGYLCICMTKYEFNLGIKRPKKWLWHVVNSDKLITNCAFSDLPCFRSCQTTVLMKINRSRFTSLKKVVGKGILAVACIWMSTQGSMRPSNRIFP